MPKFLLKTNGYYSFSIIQIKLPLFWFTRIFFTSLIDAEEPFRLLSLLLVWYAFPIIGRTTHNEATLLIKICYYTDVRATVIHWIWLLPSMSGKCQVIGEIFWQFIEEIEMVSIPIRTHAIAVNRVQLILGRREIMACIWNLFHRRCDWTESISVEWNSRE